MSGEDTSRSGQRIVSYNLCSRTGKPCATGLCGIQQTHVRQIHQGQKKRERLLGDLLSLRLNDWRFFSAHYRGCRSIDI